MNDKKPLMSSEDYGKDEDTAETLIKKHEVIEKDLIGICLCACLSLCVSVCVCLYVCVCVLCICVSIQYCLIH